MKILIISSLLSVKLKILESTVVQPAPHAANGILENEAIPVPLIL